MTKGFQRTAHTVTDGNGNVTTSNKFESRMIGVGHTQNRDGTYALDVVDAMLAHHEMPMNRFSAKHYPMVANQWNDAIRWRPTVDFRCMRRIRNNATGALNPSTAILDLNNGTGAAAANDVCIVTWVHKGSLNDNINDVHFWIRRTLVGGPGNSTIRLALCDVTNTVTAAGAANMNVLTGEFNASLAGGDHDKVPLALDPADYATAALAYAEVPCADIPAGGNGQPVHFSLEYNAAAVNGPLVVGNVYALILYLYQDNVADTDTFEIFGSQLAADDNESFTYFGAAGWNGLIAQDATCLAAAFCLGKTCDCVINQIHFYSTTGNTLGGAQIAVAAISKDTEGRSDNEFETNINEPTVYTRSLLHDIELGDQREHRAIFEGKALIPRRHFLYLQAMVTYTGDLIMEVNFWACPCGNTQLPT